MQETNNLHQVIIEDKKKISISGTAEVLCLTEEKICLLLSSSKRLVIEGNSLKMGNFSKQSGMFSASGNITSLKYTGEKSGTLKKLFK